MGQFLLSDANPFIAYLILTASFSSLTLIQTFLPVRRIFYRVGQQVLQHPPEQLAVTEEIKRPVWTFEVESDIFYWQPPGEIIQHGFGENAQVQVLQL